MTPLTKDRAAGRWAVAVAFLAMVPEMERDRGQRYPSPLARAWPIQRFCWRCLRSDCRADGERQPADDVRLDQVCASRAERCSLCHIEWATHVVSILQNRIGWNERLCDGYESP